MNEWKAGAKVGVVVLVVAILGYWAFKKVHEGVGAGSGYTLKVRFKDATGLVKKSRVLTAGLRVGQITGMRLVGNEAEISIFLKKGMVVYSNGCVLKKTASLMGEFYLEIDPGTPQSPNPKDPKGPPIHNRRLHDGDRVQCVQEATTMDQLMRRAAGLGPELEGLVKDLRKIVRGPLSRTITATNNAIDKNADALHRIIVKADSIAGDVKTITGPIPPDVIRTIRNIRVITDRLKVASTDVKDLIRSGKGTVEDTGTRIARTLEKLDRAIDKLDRALSHAPATGKDVAGIARDVKHVTGRIAAGKGNLGKFLKDETIADNVKEITQDTKDLVKSVTGLHTIIGLRTEYNVLAGTVKSYVKIRLQPKFNKYYLVELIDEPRGRLETSETVVHSGDVDGPVLTHTTTQTVEHKFRFSFMFAKRVDFATFRFGIKESTGGVGLDLHFLGDALNFTTDVFDFSVNDWPRLRFSLSWEFYKRMSLVAGIDDVLNGRGDFGGGIGRDYFAGAQITFDDEDLKALLLFAGSALGSAASQ